MKTILLVAAIFIYTLSNAQDTLINVDADTSIYLIRLQDNTSLSGKIMERKSNEIIFNDLTIGRIIIPLKKIEKMTRLSGNQYCIITTHDGKTFTGLIIAQNDTELTLQTESLGNINISNSKIRDIRFAEKEQIVNGRYFFTNPHPTRYFFVPSAIPLDKGEGYFQNAYLISNSFQMGVTDHFSMGGGVIIPILFFITPKISYKVKKNLYLGGGILVASTLARELAIGLGVAYGSITIGNKENNFTINGGWGFVKQENYNYQTNSTTKSWEFAKRPIFSISGSVRLAPKVAMISENWVFATKEYIYNSSTSNDNYTYKYNSILSFGFRLMGEKNSIDLAVAIPFFEGETFGFPYIDYVFKF